MKEQPKRFGYHIGKDENGFWEFSFRTRSFAKACCLHSYGYCGYGFGQYRLFVGQEVEIGPLFKGNDLVVGIEEIALTKPVSFYRSCALEWNKTMKQIARLEELELIRTGALVLINGVWAWSQANEFRGIEK